MTISMYTSSVPVFKRQLGAVLHWLDKADAHAQARRFDPSNYLQLRFAPDMLPLVWQIRIAGDTAKGCVARLAAIEPPKFEDDETRLDELRARLRRTIDFVASVGPHTVEGSDEREITLVMRNRDPLTFAGQFYLEHWALPNFYFHCTTAYALLRHAGVELGKADFLNVT